MKTLFNFKNEMLDSLLDGEIKNVVFNILYQIEDIKTKFENGGNCFSIAFFDYKNLSFEMAIFEKKEENGKLSFNLFIECNKQGIFLPIDKNIQPSYDSVETLQQIVNKGFESILKDIDAEFKEEINKAKPKLEQYLKYETFVYEFCRENKMVKTMNTLGINNYHEFFNKYATERYATKSGLQFDEFIGFDGLNDITYKETYNKLLPYKINELAQIDKANHREKTFTEFITALNEGGFDLKYSNNDDELKEKYNDYKNAISSNLKISKDENDDNEVQEDNMDEYMNFNDDVE